MPPGNWDVTGRRRSRSKSGHSVIKSNARHSAGDKCDGNQVDCSNKPNPSYYNSQKLLQNQQQQTIGLLAPVPAFSGMRSTKFEHWIQHFERVVDTSDFEEGRKIELLASKLFESAGDFITTFQLN